MFDLDKAVNAAIDAAEKPDAAQLSVPIPTPLAPAELKARQGRSLLALALSSSNAPQMAEAYALMGEFESAIFSAEGERLAEYEKILLAISRHESDWCECPEVLGHGARSVKTKFEKDRFIRRGREMSLFCCSSCGFMNAV